MFETDYGKFTIDIKCVKCQSNDIDLYLDEDKGCLVVNCNECGEQDELYA